MWCAKAPSNGARTPHRELDFFGTVRVVRGRKLCEDVDVPLSEDEQRILRQIEEQLQRDPGFGRTLHPRGRGSRRAMALSGGGAIVGLVLTIALLSVSPYLAFVAFVAAVAAALVCEHHLRVVGRESIESLSENVRTRFGQPPRPDR